MNQLVADGYDKLTEFLYVCLEVMCSLYSIILVWWLDFEVNLKCKYSNKYNKITEKHSKKLGRFNRFLEY